jgi:threonine aldolase
MQDSDDRPDLDDEGVAMALREATEAGEVLLEGAASVQLVIGIADAMTPIEAVEAVIRRIAHVGLDSFTFAVTDNSSGESHFVRAGRLVSLEEMREAVQNTQGDGQD